MNFYIRNNPNLEKENEKNFMEKEMVIIENFKDKNLIILNFPRNRFNNIEEKIFNFMQSINAEYNGQNQIITNANNYQIYEAFYICFF